MMTKVANGTRPMIQRILLVTLLLLLGLQVGCDGSAENIKVAEDSVKEILHLGQSYEELEGELSKRRIEHSRDDKTRTVRVILRDVHSDFATTTSIAVVAKYGSNGLINSYTVSFAMTGP